MSKQKIYLKTLNGKKINMLSLDKKYQNSPEKMVSYLTKYTGAPKDEVISVVKEYFLKEYKQEVLKTTDNEEISKKGSFLLKLSKIIIATSLILTAIILSICYIVYNMKGQSKFFMSDIVNVFNNQMIGFKYYFIALFIIAAIIITLFLLFCVFGLWQSHKIEIKQKIEEKEKNNDTTIEMFFDESKKNETLEEYLDKK